MKNKNIFDKNFENKFNQALSLKNDKKLVESLEIFKQLETEEVDYYLTFTMMGDIYWDLGELDDASKYFEKAVKLNPDSEKVSIAYFNVLWENEKKVEALNEMKRFLTNNESETYQEILKEINETE